MSRPTPRPTYAPDPNGWIDTIPSSSSSSRRPTQRPLLSFNHGIATPLSSGYKSAKPGPGPSASANIRKRLYDQTPLGQVKDRQGTLNRYLNTPSTMSDKERKLPLSDKDAPVQSHNSVRSGLIFGSNQRNQTDQGQGRGVQGSKLKVRDDFWHSDDAEEEDLQKKATLMMASQIRGKSQRKVLEKENQVRLPPISQQRSLKKDEVASAKTHKKTDDRPEISSSSRRRTSEIVRNVIEPSLPPPAQSTRSHDKSLRSQERGMTGTPAQSTRSHHHRSPSPTPPRKSPSLPELTPSLSPEPETEPTQPRAPSSSPGPFDPLPPTERTPLISKISSPPPPPITPIPDWVMNNHRQVNGRNPSQFAAIPSPWRRRDEHPHPPDDEPPQASDGKMKKRKREISKEEEVNRRVLLAAHEKRHKTPSPGKKEKKLVDLSSSDPPGSEPMLENEEKKAPSETPSPSNKRSKASGREGRKALTPIKVNALRGTISSSNIGRKPSQQSPFTPRSRPRKGLPIPVSPLPRDSIMQMQRDQYTERERSLSPSPIKATSKVFPRLSGKSPSSATDLTNRIDEVEEREQLHARLNKAENVGRGSEPPHTPRKPSPKRYHRQITSSRARSIRPRLTERQETLFVLPDPPAQPRFPTPRRGGKADDGPREWKAAEMEPETLLYWGLDHESVDTKDGIEAQDNALPEEEVAQEQDERDRVQSQSPTPEPPLFSPGLEDHSPEHGKDRRPSFGHRWSSKSIEPTALSQDFPRLLASSPTPSNKEDKSPSRSSPSLAGRRHDGTDNATREDPQSDAMKPKPASSSQWDHLNRGILAAGTSQPPKASQKQNKKRKSRSTADEKEQQSKLASFGFFNDRPNKRMNRDFEKKWEDEEDLDIDIPEDDQVIEAGQEEEKGKGKKLDKVPSPPLHPSLRPAGIRELQRREGEKSRSGFRGSPDQGITPNRKNTTTTAAAAAITLSSPEPPLFDVRTSSLTSGTGSSQTSWSKTPGSTREWWDKLGNRRTSEFGTME
ncbi:uncharacterized protein L199_005455 [Kwoniella botswanensis]|uniref:uncharacterized protein n=1 Tax=Kwoniella botswanensis TaxID=1268659 RepID=UPI00315DB8C2